MRKKEGGKGRERGGEYESTHRVRSDHKMNLGLLGKPVSVRFLSMEVEPQGSDFYTSTWA